MAGDLIVGPAGRNRRRRDAGLALASGDNFGTLGHGGRGELCGIGPWGDSRGWRVAQSRRA